jgi:hypothetical protein
MTNGLTSWKGAAKKAIVDFVTSAMMPGPGFVEVADRVATFDNDGTLWVEPPLPRLPSREPHLSASRAHELVVYGLGLAGAGVVLVVEDSPVVPVGVVVGAGVVTVFAGVVTVVVGVVTVVC